MAAIPVPALNNPLQVDVTTFISGKQATFNVINGSNFTLPPNSNVISVDLSSSVASWTTQSFTATSVNTLSITGTPTLTLLPPGNTLGDLTVTINKNTPNPSPATTLPNAITYKPAVARR